VKKKPHTVDWEIFSKMTENFVRTERTAKRRKGSGA